MDRNEIVKAVNSIFVERFELEESELTPEKNIIEDLQLDSLDLVDMIVGLQQKFGIMLRDNPEIRNVRTLNDVYDLFEKLAKEHPEIAEKIR
ncbi:MAG: acyl carrier protein [Lentisphaeria bacterium]|nr:acyl carrier protein [Lentisphaeria bacterium]